MRVAVIGAGPSGLATLKYLRTAHQFLDVDPIDVILFEAEDSIGGTFAHRTYEDAELVSSKQLTTFSDFRPTKEDPDFLSTARYVQYLHQYCDHFDLWPAIRLSSPVTSIRRKQHSSHVNNLKGTRGGHVLSFVNKSNNNEPLEYTCDAIAVCSGLHVKPNIPFLAGIDNVPQYLHSSEFKSKSQFGVGKTVLILGSGETGMDLGFMAVTSPTKRVLMSHRDGFLCAPKRVPDPVILPIMGNKADPTRLNVPVDSSSASLFDTAYVHPRLRDHMILWQYYDLFIKSTLWLVGGSKYGLAQQVGGISDGRYHASKIFFNKSNKAMPYISAPYKAEAEASLVDRIRSSLIQVPVADTHGRQIDLAPWPEKIDKQGVVHFRDNGRVEYTRLKDEVIKPDIVIFATGYTQTFPFFNSPTSPESSSQHGEYYMPGQLNVRDIWHTSDPSVGYIGFVRPSFGAIPPLAEMQAQLWVLNLVAPDKIPSKLKPEDEPHYRLKHPVYSRIQYGVDHESYAYQLALDMGSAPSLGDVIRAGWRYPTTVLSAIPDNPTDMIKEKAKKGVSTGVKYSQTQPVPVKGAWYKLPLVWALGANFNAKFRLVGPWRWDVAQEVLVDELWDTIERRGGFFGHVTLSGIPMLVFGSISLFLWLFEPILRLVWGTNTKRKRTSS
ncbi:hypothetical protein V8F20_011742 [Naviculisporaceae sp. PSN 640]